ncbi:MAG: thioredoxin domain-containing protein, partial [Deltaproteobacteria bacterium]|nr:thioredoxin domain-containing protein [Deltaproteobacteria bacterium]
EPGPLPGIDVVDRSVSQSLGELDHQWGGRNGAPKFPSHLPIRLLLAVAARRDAGELVGACRLTLLRMTQGGIHDHVAGGWHRYSTDSRWFAPHFEKMLYDQALIVMSLLDLHRANPEPWSEYAVRRTLDYLLRDLRHPGGPFYAATDADSEGREGWYFTWPWAEVRGILGDDLAEFAERYRATERGNFFGEHGEFPEGRNLLHCNPLATGEFPPTPAMVKALDRLRTARERREPPIRDDKVLCSWNGLAIGALARAGWRLGEPGYVQAAAEAADGLLAQLLDEQGTLHRSALAGRRGPAGFLDDYAFLVAGLLDLLQATGGVRWLRQAARLQCELDARFGDPQGGWFQTPLDGERLLARPQSEYDGAEPAGQSVAAANALRLYRWTDDPAWLASCDKLLERTSRELARIPLAYAEMLRVVEARQQPARSIVLVLPEVTHPDEAQWQAVVRESIAEFDVALVVRTGDNYTQWLDETPLLHDRPAESAHPCAYVCRDGVCALPARDLATLKQQCRGQQSAP